MGGVVMQMREGLVGFVQYEWWLCMVCIEVLFREEAGVESMVVFSRSVTAEMVRVDEEFVCM